MLICYVFDHHKRCFNKQAVFLQEISRQEQKRLSLLILLEQSFTVHMPFLMATFTSCTRC